jgi:hypothetical protein
MIGAKHSAQQNNATDQVELVEGTALALKGYINRALAWKKIAIAGDGETEAMRDKMR